MENQLAQTVICFLAEFSSIAMEGGKENRTIARLLEYKTSLHFETSLWHHQQLCKQTDLYQIFWQARRTLELSAELRGIRALRLKAIAHVCAQILTSFPAFETLRRESNVFDNFRLWGEKLVCAADGELAA